MIFVAIFLVETRQNYLQFRRSTTTCQRVAASSWFLNRYLRETYSNCTICVFMMQNRWLYYRNYLISLHLVFILNLIHLMISIFSVSARFLRGESRWNGKLNDKLFYAIIFFFSSLFLLSSLFLSSYSFLFMARV